jgi:hypothetical protein
VKGGLLTAWLMEVVLVTYRAVKQTTDLPVAHLPLPSTYVSTMIVYGTLGLLPGEAAGAASLMGWGLVVATLLNLWNPGGATLKGQAAAASTKQPTATPTAPAPAPTKIPTPASIGTFNPF